MGASVPEGSNDIFKEQSAAEKLHDRLVKILDTARKRNYPLLDEPVDEEAGRRDRGVVPVRANPIRCKL